MLLGKVAENENDQIADMLIAIKFIACLLDMGKLGVVDAPFSFTQVDTICICLRSMSSWR